MLLKGVVALHQRLQPKAPGGVANLRSPQDPEAPVDVFARNGGLDLLDAHEVLLIERAQSIQSILELVEGAVDLLRLHGRCISAYGHRSSHHMSC
ncbi:MAG TPA: hypothetical protein VHC69_05320 [Polyangiaceae bacterium]|nr:hypothetical protein [Polyangiaceae bacterium]